MKWQIPVCLFYLYFQMCINYIFSLLQYEKPTICNSSALRCLVIKYLLTQSHSIPPSTLCTVNINRNSPISHQHHQSVIIAHLQRTSYPPPLGGIGKNQKVSENTNISFGYIDIYPNKLPHSFINNPPSPEDNLLQSSLCRR